MVTEMYFNSMLNQFEEIQPDTHLARNLTKLDTASPALIWLLVDLRSISSSRLLGVSET